MVRIVLLVIIFLYVSSCEGNKNYKVAYIIREKNLFFIKLTGKRELISHDPQDIIKAKTYDDSLIIPIPSLKDGVVKGEDIPVKKGYYKYKGKLVINNKILEVSLFYDNYDDKKLEPLSWNGRYKLVNK